MIRGEENSFQTIESPVSDEGASATININTQPTRQTVTPQQPTTPPPTTPAPGAGTQKPVNSQPTIEQVPVEYVTREPKQKPAKPADEGFTDYTVVSSTSPKATHTTTKQTTTTTREAGTPKTTTKTGINWGGVVKGVAIIGAVVLVGVAGFYGASTAASWALGTPAGAAIASTVAEVSAPVMAAAENGVAWMSGFLPHVPTVIGNFFTGLFGTAAATGTGAAATAATATAVGVSTSAVAATAGTVVAGGAAAITTAKLAVPVLESTHLTTQHQVTTTPVTTSIDVSNSDPVIMETAHHHHDAAHNAHIGMGGMESWEIANHKTHIVNNHLQHQQAAHGSNQNQQGDVSADAGDLSGGDVSAPDADLDESQLEKIARRSPSSWRSRLSGGNSFTNTLKNGGSYSSAVIASRTPDASAITSRGADYSAAVKDERAKAAESEASLA